jgi:CRISPR-associated protein Cmr2
MEADKKGPPPAYYAVLTMDGDDMGKWLSGKKTPRIGDILHQTIVDYLKTLPDCETVQRALNAPRPVGPALHAAISEALSNFAIHVVPGIVEASHGTLIYAGGDDVLALLPARSALKCAGELRLAFSGDPLYNGNAKCPGFFRKDGRDLLMMGAKASLSAGLAVVHYKEDLREAIEAARTAERAAKNSGKDALQLAILRRSGEHSSALCSWDRVTQIEEWVYAFEQGASDRWAYHLRQEIPTLSALPLEAIQAEIRRQVDRSEQGTRERLCPDNPKAAGSAIAEAFATYHALRLEREKAAGEGELRLDGRFLEDFICLCQSASFLARGRDR